MKLLWEEALIFDVEVMDEEHIRLFEHVDELFETLGDTESSTTKVKEVIGFLEKYVDDHFKHEDEFFVKYNYPLLEEHRKAHDEFRLKVEGLYSLLDSETIKSSVKIKINQMIISWLKEHIGVEDRKAADYIKSL